MSQRMSKIIAITVAGDNIASYSVGLLAGEARPDRFARPQLSFQHNIVYFLKTSRRLTYAHRSGHIAIVTQVACAHINDKRFAFLQLAFTRYGVRGRPVRAAGHNGIESQGF